MAVYTCSLEVSGSKVLTTWSKNAAKIKIGDSVKFVSKYGNVRLEFAKDCPFFPDKIGSVVAFFVKGETPVSLKVKRLGRGKLYPFLCVKGEASSWDPKANPEAGGEIPPSKPPGT